MGGQTREEQYGRCLELQQDKGLTKLGLMTNQGWHDDPRRLLFMLARYKFVAKMLSGTKRALEVGCGDSFAAPIVLQEVEQLVATDFDPLLIREAQERMADREGLELRAHDILEGPVDEGFDAAYSLDVIEHVPAEDEERFVGNMVRSLSPTGILLLGSPSLESQQYASPISKAGHINCKTQSGLKELVGRFFHNVFMFGMNDEVVHTGFAPMAHYLWAVGSTRRDGDRSAAPR